MTSGLKFVYLNQVFIILALSLVLYATIANMIITLEL